MTLRTRERRATRCPSSRATWRRGMPRLRRSTARLRSYERTARETRQQAFLAEPHRRRLALLIHGMIVPQHVQDAVYHEARDLATHGLASLDRVLASDVRTDVNVADDGIGFRRTRESER